MFDKKSIKQYINTNFEDGIDIGILCESIFKKLIVNKKTIASLDFKKRPTMMVINNENVIYNSNSEKRQSNKSVRI
jgi:hypothetical protein